MYTDFTMFGERKHFSLSLFLFSSSEPLESFSPFQQLLLPKSIDTSPFVSYLFVKVTF
jgi:hypothetical protein